MNGVVHVGQGGGGKQKIEQNFKIPPLSHLKSFFTLRPPPLTPRKKSKK